MKSQSLLSLKKDNNNNNNNYGNNNDNKNNNKTMSPARPQIYENTTGLALLLKIDYLVFPTG